MVRFELSDDKHTSGKIVLQGIVAILTHVNNKFILNNHIIEVTIKKKQKAISKIVGESVKRET